MIHWHRCARWWRLNLACPYSSLVEHDDDQEEEVKVPEKTEDFGIESIPADEVIEVGKKTEAPRVVSPPARRPPDVQAPDREAVEEAEDAVRDLPVPPPAPEKKPGRVPRDVPRPIPRRVPVPPIPVPIPPPPVKKGPVRIPVPVGGSVVPVGNVEPFIEALHPPNIVVPPARARARSSTFMDLVEELRRVEVRATAAVGMAGALSTSELMRDIPLDFRPSHPLQKYLDDPITVSSFGSRMLFIPRDRNNPERAKPANVAAAVSEEAFLQQMELGVRTRRMRSVNEQARESTGRITQAVKIGVGAVAAGAAGGFFFNARRRLQGLLN